MSENQINEKNENNAPEQKKKRSRGMLALIAAICGLVLIAGGFFVYSATYKEIYPRVEVAGINLGGLTREDAQIRLDEGIAKMDTNRTITFVCDQNSKEVMLTDLGIGIDSKKTAEAAFAIGRSGGFFGKSAAMLSSWFKNTQAQIFAKADSDLLEGLISEVAGEFEIPMTETTYEIEGNNLTLIKGNPGMMVNRDKVLIRIADALLDPEIKKIELDVEWTEPKTVDLDTLYAELTQPLTNAEYSMVDGKVVIIPEKGGITVDKNQLRTALESGEQRYTIAINAEKPETTAKELEELLFRDVIGTYSSDFSTSSQARASNVELTANRINGYILMPGDVFSYDKTVGRRTAANGYKEAGVYIGNKVESGIGGGICQTSSTLYCAALYANLEIVQRTSHSLPIAYVPAGMDATIAEGYIDLQIKNNTPYPVKIQATVKGRRLTCELLGVKDHDISVEIVNTTTAVLEPETDIIENAGIPIGYKKILSKGAKGYRVASKRIVKSKGESIKEEKLTGSTYRATSTEVEVNPADKETPLDTLKIYVEEEYIKEQQGLPAEEAKPEVPENTEGDEIQEEPEEVPVDEVTETVEIVDLEPQTEE